MVLSPHQLRSKKRSHQQEEEDGAVGTERERERELELEREGGHGGSAVTEMTRKLQRATSRYCTPPNNVGKKI